MQAIGSVKGRRTKAVDNYGGGAQSCIVLRKALETEALQGPDAFSHVEVTCFNQV